MKCDTCGRDNLQDAAFCSGCGSKLQSVSRCLKCGRENHPDAAFCSGCGEKTGDAPPAPPITQEQLAKAPSKKTLLTIVGGCVAAIIIGAFALTRPDKAAVEPLAPPESVARDSSMAQEASVPEDVGEAGSPAPAAPQYAGALAIDTQFEALNGGFDEYGLARVKIGDFWYLIDLDGNIITGQPYESIDFYSNELAVVVRGGKYGYIDTEGNEVIAPQFENAFSFGSDELARISKGGKWGFINMNGNIVIDAVFLDARDFSEGFAAVTKNGSSYYFTDRNGTNLYGDFQSAMSHSEGLAAVRKSGKWGYVRHSGNMIIEPQFDSADEFIDGLAIVEKNGLQFFIDMEGNPFSPEFTQVWRFSNGYATVKLDDKYGFISRDTGELVIYPEYVNADIYAFSCGLANVSLEKGAWIYINENQETQFDGKTWQEAHEFNSGISKVRQSGKWGLIDITGNEVTPVIWDDTLTYSGGMVGVLRGGKWGFLMVVDKSAKAAIEDLEPVIIALETVPGYSNRSASAASQANQRQETSKLPASSSPGRFVSSDLDDWGLPYGMTFDEFIAKYNIDDASIDFIMEAHRQGFTTPRSIDVPSLGLNISFEPDTLRISGVSVYSPNQVGPRNFRIGMRLTELLGTFYCDNPTAMTFAETLNSDIFDTYGSQENFMYQIDIYEAPDTDGGDGGAYLGRYAMREYTANYYAYYSSMRMTVFFDIKTGLITGIDVLYDYPF